jgi:ADP-ribose pyrophosphatase
MYVPEILERREVATNRFMTYVEEDLRSPDGSVYTYHQVEARWQAVLVLPVLADGRLVLERIYRHPYRRYLLEFPAGGIDTGEDPVHAAGRELTEETGYRAGSLRKLGVYEAIPGMLHARVHVVLATDLVQTGTRAHETMELLRVEEMTLDQAWNEATTDTASSFLTVGLLWLEKDARSR